MSFLFSADKNTLQSNHGWDVELTCPKCGFGGAPRYEGWSHNLETCIGANVRVYAKLACPKCGRRLIDEAGRKLVELFSRLDISGLNKDILKQFITLLFLVPALLAFVLFFGMQMDWWGWGLGTVWILLISSISIPALLFVKNKRLAELPFQCACGKPHNVYMGMVDNSHCYRCFSCGRLMKVRE